MLLRKILKLDIITLLCTLILLGIGIFTLYSLTTTSLQSRQEYFQKEFTSQVIFTVTGFTIAILAFMISPIYLRFRLVLGIFYVSTILILILTLIIGTDIRGVKRWITIGGSLLSDGTVVGGLTIQPSEFAKIIVILCTSALFSLPIKTTIKENTGKIQLFIINNQNIIIAYALDLVVILIIFLQKSLSVTLIVALIVLSIIFANVKNKSMAILTILAFMISFIMSQNILFDLTIWARIILFFFSLAIYAFSVFFSKLHTLTIFIAIILGIITGAILLSFTWNHVLQDYQKVRVETFLNPTKDTSSTSFQQEQSKISIGAGQYFGHGFENTSDSRLLLLPEPTTDFIFAIFGFKFGFIGSLIIIILYLILITRLFYLSDKMNDRFSSLVLIGIASMILFQFFSNIGMNLDVLPVGGTTLPLISAGGSSLLSMIISIAIAENIIASNRIEKGNYKNKDKIIIDGWNN